MMFAGLVSTHLILRGSVGDWPPAGQPRLPIGTTAAATALLLMSGVTAHLALSQARRSHTPGLLGWLAATAVLGCLFAGVQGYEWVRLIGYGLTFTSSVYGAAFYTVIGAHGAHVLLGLVVLAVTLTRAALGRYDAADHSGVSLSAVYWTFVVGVWPVLYVLVYLV